MFILYRDIGSVIQTMYGDEPPEIILFGHRLSALNSYMFL